MTRPGEYGDKKAVVALLQGVVVQRQQKRPPDAGREQET